MLFWRQSNFSHAIVLLSQVIWRLASWRVAKLVWLLALKLAKSGFTAEQLGELLHAQHAKERNEAIAKINPDMPDGGSGHCFPGGHVSSALAFVGLALPWLGSGLTAQRRIGQRMLVGVLLAGFTGFAALLRSASRPLHRLQPAKRQNTAGCPALAPSPCKV